MHKPKLVYLVTILTDPVQTLQYNHKMTNEIHPSDLVTKAGQSAYLETLIRSTDEGPEFNQTPVLRDFFEQAPADAEKFIINCSDHESPVVRKLASLAVENLLDTNPDAAVIIIKKSINDKTEEVATTARDYYRDRLQEDGLDLLKKIGLNVISKIILGTPQNTDTTARVAASDAHDARADKRQDVADTREVRADKRQEVADTRELRIITTAKDIKTRIGDAQARIGDAQAELEAADMHMETLRAEVAAVVKLEGESLALRKAADEQISTAAAALAEAKDDSAEYERAVYHYTSLIRHRIANPLQTIIGMSQTLLEMPDLSPEKRLEMIKAVHEQSLVLSTVSLEPYSNDVTEQGLRPLPSTGNRSQASSKGSSKRQEQ